MQPHTTWICEIQGSINRKHSPGLCLHKQFGGEVRQAVLNSNSGRGTGGQSKLARMLGWHHSTVWRKLNGKSAITESDALAIQKVMEMAEKR